MSIPDYCKPQRYLAVFEVNMDPRYFAIVRAHIEEHARELERWTHTLKTKNVNLIKLEE